MIASIPLIRTFVYSDKELLVGIVEDTSRNPFVPLLLCVCVCVCVSNMNSNVNTYIIWNKGREIALITSWTRFRTVSSPCWTCRNVADASAPPSAALVLSQRSARTRKRSRGSMSQTCKRLKVKALFSLSSFSLLLFFEVEESEVWMIWDSNTARRRK